MVLPRPYANRKSLSRVSKQQYYQQAVAAQHTQAAAAAANYHHYQQQQQQQQTQALTSRRPSKRSGSSSSNSSSTSRVAKPVNKYAISLRDSAIIRYVRYREWAEFVVGTAPLPALSDWRPQSLEDDIKQKEEELAQVRAELSSAVEANDTKNSGEKLLNLSEKAKFYDSATAQLRASFPSSLGGASSSSSSVSTVVAPDMSEAELQDKFGLVAVPSAPVVRLSAEQIGDLGLPVYKQAPPQEELDAWIAEHEAKAKAKAAEVAATAAAAAAAATTAAAATPTATTTTTPVATIPQRVSTSAAEVPLPSVPIVTENHSAPVAAAPVFVPAMQDATSLLATAVAAATGGAITPTGFIPPTPTPPVVDPANMPTTVVAENTSLPVASGTAVVNGISKSPETTIYPQR